MSVSDRTNEKFAFVFRMQLKDIVGNEAIVERLKVIAAQGNMNNVILAVRSPDRDKPALHETRFASA